jgi:phage tail-like protein
MTVERDQPYGNYNFIVSIDGGEVVGGFSDLVLPEVTVEVIEYRAGADRANTVRKLPGLVKYSNLSLKRGITGSLYLFKWIAAVRDGATGARRTVLVQLQNEDRTETVWTWKLTGAFPVKYVSPTLHGKGSDVALEELVLACDRLDIE